MKRAILRRNNSFTATAQVNDDNTVSQIDIAVTGYWSTPINLRAPTYNDKMTSITYSSGGYDKSCTNVESIRNFARALEWAVSMARLMDDGWVVGKERFDISVECWLDPETGAEVAV